MLSLLTMTALAGDLDDKLLGDAPTIEAAAPAQSGGGLDGWGIVLGALALGGFTIIVRTKMQERVPKAWRLDDSGIEVIAKKNLGAGAGLAIVEVEDGSGGVRRLLVGVGNGGPNLVSDLSSMAEVDEAWDALTTHASQPAPRPARTAQPTEAPAPRRVEQQPAPAPVTTAEVDQILARKAVSRRPWAGSPEPRAATQQRQPAPATRPATKSREEQRADKARDLVQQVLRARNGQWAG